MAKTHRYSASRVAEALTKAHGMVTVAAQLLGCSPDTVDSYVKKFAVCAQAKQTARNAILDEAELRLVQAIRRDEAWAIAFCLRTIGRSRGYVEGVDVNLSVTIQAAAAKVASEFGLSAAEVLQEARLLLMEVSDA
jgi:hypothetical protein